MLNISKKTVFFLLSAVALLLTSCKDTETYSDHLKAEKSKIRSYIRKNNIAVTSTKPTGNDEWFDEDGNPLYYKFSDGLYYHQISKGDTTTTAPKTGCNVYVRYVGKTVEGMLWYDFSEAKQANPESFKLVASPSTDYQFGEGFQKAVRQMYTDGHCLCIIPFKIGNGYNVSTGGVSSSDSELYRTMVYEIWVKRIE